MQLKVNQDLLRTIYVEDRSRVASSLFYHRSDGFTNGPGRDGMFLLPTGFQDLRRASSQLPMIIVIVKSDVDQHHTLGKLVSVSYSTLAPSSYC